MDVLPSYEEATLAPDCLQLAAPYLTAADCRRCCLVSSTWYRQFAPRLWLDPLITVRDLGLHPNDGKRPSCSLIPFPPCCMPRRMMRALGLGGSQSGGQSRDTRPLLTNLLAWATFINSTKTSGIASLTWKT